MKICAATHTKLGHWVFLSGSGIFFFCFSNILSHRLSTWTRTFHFISLGLEWPKVKKIEKKNFSTTYDETFFWSPCLAWCLGQINVQHLWMPTYFTLLYFTVHKFFIYSFKFFSIYSCLYDNCDCHFFFYPFHTFITDKLIWIEMGKNLFFPLSEHRICWEKAAWP